MSNLSNRIIDAGFLGMAINLLAAMFYLVFARDIPPYWMAYPFPFFLSAVVIGMSIERR